MRWWITIAALLGALALAAHVGVDRQGLEPASTRAPRDAALQEGAARVAGPPAPGLTLAGNARDRGGERATEGGSHPQSDGARLATAQRAGQDVEVAPAEEARRRALIVKEIARIESSSTAWERAWADDALRLGGAGLRVGVRKEQADAWRSVSLAAVQPERRPVTWLLWLGPRRFLDEARVDVRSVASNALPKGGWLCCDDAMVAVLTREVHGSKSGLRLLAQGRQGLRAQETLEIGPVEGVRALVRLLGFDKKSARVELALRRCTPSGLEFSDRPLESIPTAGTLLVSTFLPLNAETPDDTMAYLLLTVGDPPVAEASAR